MVSYYLYTVLVGAYRSVCSQTPELTRLSSSRRYVRIFRRSKGQMRYIVVYRNGEFFFRLVTPEIFINGQNISRLSVFGTQTIASSH